MIPTNSKSVLDFGCGTGRLIPFLDSIIDEYKYYGVDICKGAIVYNQSKYHSSNHIFFSHIDNNTLDIKDNSIESVFAITVFLHITDSDVFEKMCNEIKRVMTQSATVIILDTNVRPQGKSGPWGHIYHDPKDLMEKLGCVVLGDIIYSDESAVKNSHWCCKGVVKHA